MLYGKLTQPKIKHIIDFMNLPYEDRERFLPFCTCYEEMPVFLTNEKEDKPT